MRTVTEFSGVVVKRALELRTQKASEGLEGEALTEAVGAEVGVTGDRLARLSELLEAGGDKLGNVRLVRVLQPGENEQPPQHALTVGEFHYVFDRMPAASRGPGRDGGRGGRGGREGGRGGGGGGGGFGGGGFGGGGGGRGRGGERDGGERINPREVPVAGAGWMMTKAARDPDEDRGRGPKGRGGPRGPRRDRPGGGGPGGDRRGAGPRGPRPPMGGPRPPMGAPPMGAGGQPGPKTEVSGAELAGGGGDPAKRRRRRGGRGRRPGGPGGPGAPGGQPGAPQMAAPQQDAQAPEIQAQAPPPESQALETAPERTPDEQT